MRILRSADYRRMPWKNGKGETVEIAVFPPSATVGDFDWRISMAPVVSDGAFSTFEGIDRTLSILTGESILLSVEGKTAVVLGSDSAPFSFRGDARTVASLKAGPITDLNVMTRRDRFSHRVSCVRQAGDIQFSVDAAFVIIVVTGKACLTGIDLDPLDAVLLENIDDSRPWKIETREPYFLAEIFTAPSG